MSSPQNASTETCIMIYSIMPMDGFNLYILRDVTVVLSEFDHN